MTSSGTLGSSPCFSFGKVKMQVRSTVTGCWPTSISCSTRESMTSVGRSPSYTSSWRGSSGRTNIIAHTAIMPPISQSKPDLSSYTRRTKLKNESVTSVSFIKNRTDFYPQWGQYLCAIINQTDIYYGNIGFLSPMYEGSQTDHAVATEEPD